MRRLAAAPLLLLALELAPTAGAQGVIHTFPGTLPQELRPTAAAGDVDGDGFGDLLVLTLSGLEVVDVRSGRTGALLRSFSGSSSAGVGPALAGSVDLDGDGRDDLVIGDPERAPFFPHPSAGGTARAVSVATGATLWSIAGAANDALGGALSAGPDVDQDGFPDVAVGADQATLTGALPGYVRVVSGATGATIATRVGPTAGARYGAEVLLLADADGDATPDLAVTARHPIPLLTWAGGVEVASAATGATLWSVTGASAGDGVGSGLQSLGDLDGDGLADVVFAAPGSDAGGADAGLLRARRGVDGASLWSFVGAPGDLLSLARLEGDADGDGVPDLLVRRQAGPLDAELRIHSGASGGFHLAFPAEVIAGFGGVGDVNGDGIADVGVGAVATGGAFTTDVEIRSPLCGVVSLSLLGCPALPNRPALAVGGCTVAGGTVTLSITSGHPNAPALLLVGAAAATTPLPGGCVLGVALPATSVPIATDATGAFAATAKLPIPTASGAAVVQVLVADPGVAGGITATEAWAVQLP